MTLMVAMLSAALAGTWGLSQVASQEANRSESVRPTFSQPLPRMDGDHLELQGVEVSYAPGASSAAHSHPCPVIAYITEGAVRSQVSDGPETIYKTGELFTRLRMASIAFPRTQPDRARQTAGDFCL